MKKRKDEYGSHGAGMGLLKVGETNCSLLLLELIQT